MSDRERERERERDEYKLNVYWYLVLGVKVLESDQSLLNKTTLPQVELVHFCQQTASLRQS